MVVHPDTSLRRSLNMKSFVSFTNLERKNFILEMLFTSSSHFREKGFNFHALFRKLGLLDSEPS
jgi:hypothetical protein